MGTARLCRMVNMPVTFISNPFDRAALKFAKYLIKMFLALFHEVGNQTTWGLRMCISQSGARFVNDIPCGVQLKNATLGFNAQHEQPVTKSSAEKDICIDKNTLGHGTSLHHGPKFS